MGAVAGSVDGTTPSATVSPGLERRGELVVVAGRELSVVDGESRGARAPEQVERRAGRARVHPGLGARAGDRVQHPAERLRGLGRVHGAVPAEAGRGRHRTGQHRGQRGLVDLDHHPVPARQPAAQVGDVDGEPLGQRLGQLAPGAEVRQHLVAARPLDGRRQRPRSGDLDLERAVVPLRLLLQSVEVLGEQAAGPAVVDARCVGEPPSRRLQVGAQLGHHGERAAGHGRGSAATGQLGEVRQVGKLAEDEPDRLVEVALVVARVRADTAGDRHRGSRPAPSSVARRSSGIGSSTTPTAWLACSRPRSVTNPTWLTFSSGRPKK